MTKRLLIAITVVAAFSTGAFAQEEVPGAATNNVIPGGAGWADSYSVNGKCYIDSTFDHGIGSVIVPTPIGGQTVRQVAERLGPGPGKEGNPLYNDVQCGNGPANNAGDEDFGQCPGRVDQGASGCGIIGPKWDLASVYTMTPPTPDPIVPVAGQCRAWGNTLRIARSGFAEGCPGIPASQRDCDPVILDGRSVWMCANYRIGDGPPSVPAPIAPIAPTPVDPTPETPPVASNGQQCTASSRAEFSRLCGNVPADCDRIDGQIMCANYQLGRSAPAGVPTLAELLGTPVVEPDPVEPSPEPVEPTPEPVDPVDPPVDPAPEPTPVVPSEPRSVLAPSAAAGYALFLQTYGVKAVDCDPAGGGQWRCSDNKIGGSSPESTPGTGSGGQTPVQPVGNTVVIEVEDFIGEFAGPKNWTRQTELGETGMKVTPDTRVTHNDPITSGLNFWNFPTVSNMPYLSYNVNVETAGEYLVDVRVLSKGSEDNGAHLWVNGSWAVQRLQWCEGKNQWTWSGRVRTNAVHCGVTGMNTVTLRAGNNDIRLGAREDGLFADKIRFTPVGSSSGDLPPLGGAGDYLDTFNQPYVDGDLVSIHFDSSMDPDDEQAAIMVREILDDNAEVDFIVVNGTKRRNNNGILPNSTSIIGSMFPGLIEAWKNDRSCATTVSGTRGFCQDAVYEVATLWQLTIAAGKRVHVAEGGPSAFTADVLRELVSRGIGNLKNIRVIQHSWGWNEQQTEQADLDVVRRYATYIRIPDGNNNNGTSDFNQNRTSAAAAFRARALQSEYADQWRRAFDDINNKVDGSDSVELMWILGIPKSFAPTTKEFADRYFD